MAEDKRLDKQIGGMAATGIGYVMALMDEQRDNLFAKKQRITLTGANQVITYASLGLPNMQDDQAMIIASGPAGLGVNVAAGTAISFTLIGGTAGDVIDVLIIGRPVGKL